MTERKKVLFICTHNSARSIMAEALLRHYYDDLYEAFSAGTIPLRVKPEAIRVLEEIGIDTSPLRSKGIESFKGMRFHIVVTVCKNAKDTCPFYPFADTYVHQGFVDPSDIGLPERRLDDFRKTRDDIRKWIDDTFESGRVTQDLRLQLFYPDRIK